MGKVDIIETHLKEAYLQFMCPEHENCEIFLSVDLEIKELLELVDQEKIDSLYTYNDCESLKLISEIEDIENAQIEIFEIDQIYDYQNYKDNHPHGEKVSGYDSEILKWHFNLLNQVESLEFYKYPYDAEFYSDISVLIFFEHDICGVITIWYIGDTIEDSYMIGDTLDSPHCDYIIDDWIRSGKTAYNLYSIWS